VRNHEPGFFYLSKLRKNDFRAAGHFGQGIQKRKAMPVMPEQSGGQRTRTEGCAMKKRNIPMIEREVERRFEGDLTLESILRIWLKKRCKGDAE
jgi:hypothetical protein